MIEKPQIPADVPEDQHEAYLIHHGKAITMREKSAATYLRGSIGPLLNGAIDGEICQTYLETLRTDANVRKDPIEQMIVEQIVLAYHNIGRLHVKAAAAQSVAQAECYNSAATRLLAEFRRLVLALREYRSPLIARQVTLVGQQNNAAGDQQIAFVPGQQPAFDGKKRGVQNELGNKGLEHVERRENFRESTTFVCNEAEPLEAKRVDGSRAAQDPGNGKAKSAVAAFDGT